MWDERSAITDGEDDAGVALFRGATVLNDLILPEVRADDREAVFRLLAERGAATAEAEYDGSGDEGYVGAVTARGPDGSVVALPREAEEAVRDFVFATLPEGWEIDGGGDGVVTFEVADRRVRYAHFSRYVEVNCDEWEA